MGVILICGSRGWKHREIIREYLLTLPKDTVIVTGAQKTWDHEAKEYIGADYLAGEIARNLGLEVREYPADWTRYGKAAGWRRNQQMLDEEQPDEVVAFKVKPKSPGTDDMLSRARRARLKTTTYTIIDDKVVKATEIPSDRVEAKQPSLFGQEKAEKKTDWDAVWDRFTPKSA